MSLTIVTEPAVGPVTLDEVKLHLRVDITDDDSLIGTLIQAAREHVETITRRALITQTWDLYMDAFPGEGGDGTADRIVLWLPPLQSVTHIKYYDDSDNESTFSSSSYHVDTDSEPGQIVLKDGESWPSDTLRQVNGVLVRFVAGYGDAGSDVPESINQAMKLIIGHYYENRESVFMGRVSPVMLPMGVEGLLATYRVIGF